ncbi:unnamed protein product [Urochloa humidicola]
MAPKAFALFLAINLFVLGTMPTDAATTCPLNSQYFDMCVNDLYNLEKGYFGILPVEPCCRLVQGLVAADAAACFCSFINGDILIFLPLNIKDVDDVNNLLHGCGYSGAFSCW